MEKHSQNKQINPNIKSNIKSTEKVPANRQISFEEPEQPLSFPSPEFCKCNSIHEIKVRKLDGEMVSLDIYKGHVCIIINVCTNSTVSRSCFKQMNELLEIFESKGLRILAFPCDQFGKGQEPIDNNLQLEDFFHDIRARFDVFDKVKVNSFDACCLFKFLKLKLPSTFGSMIKSPFTKFIVDKEGIPVERLEMKVQIKDLFFYLEKYW